MIAGEGNAQSVRKCVNNRNRGNFQLLRLFPRVFEQFFHSQFNNINKDVCNSQKYKYPTDIHHQSTSLQFNRL